MKVGLIDVDGHNFPNLPLMKLSAYHKKQGDQTGFYDPWDGLLEPYDIVYMSKVFSFTADYNYPIYSKEVHMVDSKARIDINQGMDIRLITNKNIDLIRKLKLNVVHFAYDRIEDREIIEPALKLFKEATGYDRHKVMVYILVNYNTTLDQDLHRINYVGRELGFQPYPMIYDKEHCDPIYNKLQRWCNPRIFNSTKSFEEYKRK